MRVGWSKVMAWLVVTGMVSGGWASSSLGAEPDGLPTSEPDVVTPLEQGAGSVPIRVEVAKTVVEGELFSDWIYERNQDIAARLPPFPGHEQWVSVTIGGTVYDYSVRVSAVRDGSVVGSSEEAKALLRCECSTDELLDGIDEEIDAAVERLRSTPVEVATDEGTVEFEEAVEQEMQAPSQNPRRRVGALGGIGIGLLVLGASGLGVGVPLALRATTDVRGVPGLIEQRSARAPGIAIALVGSAILVSGVALVTVDAVRRQRRTIVIKPAIGPRGGGRDVRHDVLK